MSLGAKLAIVAVAAALTVGLYFVVRPGGDDGIATSTTPTTPTPTSTGAGPTQISLTVENGKPVGGIASPQVTEGEDVEIVVTADVSDEVHLHGYDLSADVAPGEPARIDFTADTAGRFEIELESRKELLAELSVEPS